ELLEQAVRKLKKLPAKETIEVLIDLPGEAFIPRSYVPDMRMKIDLYRRLTRITAADELADLKAEMLDRFGPLPTPADRIARFARLRIAAKRWQIDSIGREEGYLVLQYSGRERIEELNQLNGRRLRIVDDRSAYMPLKGVPSDPDALLAL